MRMPPDDLIIYPVAVDAEPPRIAVEAVADEGSTPLVLLSIAEAADLAAGLLAATDTAWAVARRREG